MFGRHFFSPSTGGFYTSRIHGDAMPADAVAITRRRYRELLDAQSGGRAIVAGDDGAPAIARRPRETAEDLRSAAVSAVKREASRRILAIAPLWRQANDAADIALTACQLAATGTTAIDASAALERRRRIDQVRAASDALEATLDPLGAAELGAFDATDDTHWNIA